MYRAENHINTPTFEIRKTTLHIELLFKISKLNSQSFFYFLYKHYPSTNSPNAKPPSLNLHTCDGHGCQVTAVADAVPTLSWNPGRGADKVACGAVIGCWKQSFTLCNVPLALLACQLDSPLVIVSITSHRWALSIDTGHAGDDALYLQH